MSTKTILEICTEKGQEYAEEMGYALYNLKYGFYRVLELGEELEISKQRKESKVKEIEENITNTKTNIVNKTKNIQSIEKELDKLKTDSNSYTSKIKRKEKEIELNQDKLKKGKGVNRRDNFEYYFIGILFVAITLAVVSVYFFLWYNAFFASHSNANTYTSLIDSRFFITAFTESNYWELAVSFVLVALPLFLSYLFHLKKDSPVIRYGALILALATDIVLAYGIVEGAFLSKIFIGDFSVTDVKFNLWYCLTSKDFFLLLLIGFFAYLVWGLVYFKFKVLRTPDQHLENTIDKLEEEKNNFSHDLDECNSNIKNQEERRDNEIKNVDELKKRLEENEKILETIKIKPITTELDLKMKVSSFYVGFIKAYRDNQPKGKTESDLESEMKGKDSVVDSFVEEVKKSEKYIFI
jgi:peptidoglycan hydrolase CwlO-like protein